MAQDKVQLKREEIVGNDVVMQDINPKTKTNSITDSTKGIPLDQSLAMIKNMINNKLSRVVNSVNGRTGVVILDAGDVGLENVDNISFGDIKRWVIEYIGDIFETKRIILREYLSEIHTITGTNDKAYANTPFYCQKGAEDVSDYMAYIGYIYWDEEHELLKEEHLQVKVVGFTDKSLRYNVAHTQYANGGLGVNIWSGEDALKVMNNAISYSGFTAEDLDNAGLYIDKTKVVPDVFFFDGVYGTLTGSGENMHNQDALVYWSTDPHDTTEGNLPIIQIYVDNELISYVSSGGGYVNTIHTQQELKVGDIILTNFSYEDYFNPDDAQHRRNALYPRILDSLTMRQPAIGRVTQAADMDNNIPCIVKFYSQKPNVGHGLKLIPTNIYNDATPADTMVGLDLFECGLKMNDGTVIYTVADYNIAGINALDKYVRSYRVPQRPDPQSLYTIYPTGKSNNILSDTHNYIETDSTLIIPTFSMCVIPGYPFIDHTVRPLLNWPASSPIDTFDLDYRRNLTLLGVNLEKAMWPVNDYKNSRNISGLRIDTDTATLTEEWFGWSDQSTSAPIVAHSGGLSVNVGDFLGIGTTEEVAYQTAIDKSGFYEEGKVNVRINKMKGLYGVEGNRLAVNIAEGYVYQPATLGSPVSTWLEGGLKFLPDNDRTPSQGPLTVNTGRASSGLNVKNNFLVEPRTYRYGTMNSYVYDSNVLAVQPVQMSVTEGTGSTQVIVDRNPLAIHTGIKESDIAHLIPCTNICRSKVWESLTTMIADREYGRYDFNQSDVYVAGGEKYIYWLDDGQPRFDKYFVFYWENGSPYELVIGIGEDHTECPDDPWDPTKYYKQVSENWVRGVAGESWAVNKWYNKNDRDYDIIMDVITTGVIPEIPSASYIKPVDVLRRQCHVLIEAKDPTTNPSEYTVTASIYEYATDDLRVPDLDHNGIVDGSEATTVLTLWGPSTSIYSNPGHTEFFTDPELTTRLEPEEGRRYWDMNDYLEDPNAPGHIYHMGYIGVSSGGSVYLEKNKHNGVTMSLTDYMNADVDRDGVLSGSDASHILTFYANSSTGHYPGLSLNESWRTFLRESRGINVEPGNGSVVEICNFTYNKGLHLRYNELKGLTSNSEYFGSESVTPKLMANNDIRNSLSIKIADKSSGMYNFDPTKAGGLRFGTNGYLGIRINNNNNFSALFPSKSDVLNVDEMSIGSRGLRIYGGENDMNVLGVQLTSDGKLDNGQLQIDSNGCLRFSDNIKPDMEGLIIEGTYSDGGYAAIKYDGKEEVAIKLGPGLCFGTSNP